MFNKFTALLFFVFLLCCAFWVTYARRSLKTDPRPDPGKPVEESLVPDKPVPVISGIPLLDDHTDGAAETGVSPRFRPDQNDFYERSGLKTEATPGQIKRILTPLLADRQGSYTNLRDFMRSDDPTVVKVRSDWLAPYLSPNLPLPSLRINFARDTLTGEFRIIGGAADLFGSGFEAGYETDSEREEQRGVLQWKKSF